MYECMYLICKVDFGIIPILNIIKVISEGEDVTFLFDKYFGNKNYV